MMSPTGVLGRDTDEERHDEMSRAPWIRSTVESSCIQTLLNTFFVSSMRLYMTRQQRHHQIVHSKNKSYPV